MDGTQLGNVMAVLRSHGFALCYVGDGDKSWTESMEAVASRLQYLAGAMQGPLAAVDVPVVLAQLERHLFDLRGIEGSATSAVINAIESGRALAHGRTG